MDDHRISREVFVWQTLRERLVAQYELEESDPVLIDTLDGMTTLNERCANVALSAKEDEAFADKCREIAADYMDRAMKFERRGKYKRAAILWAMQETGQKNITAPEATISVRAGRPKLNIDQKILPREYMKEQIQLIPDRAKIDEAIANNNPPLGVNVTNPEATLSIRSK